MHTHAPSQCARPPDASSPFPSTLGVKRPRCAQSQSHSHSLPSKQQNPRKNPVPIPFTTTTSDPTARSASSSPRTAPAALHLHPRACASSPRAPRPSAPAHTPLSRTPPACHCCVHCAAHPHRQDPSSHPIPPGRRRKKPATRAEAAEADGRRCAVRCASRLGPIDARCDDLPCSVVVGAEAGRRQTCDRGSGDAARPARPAPLEQHYGSQPDPASSRTSPYRPHASAQHASQVAPWMTQQPARTAPSQKKTRQPQLTAGSAPHLGN